MKDARFLSEGLGSLTIEQRLAHVDLGLLHGILDEHAQPHTLLAEVFGHGCRGQVLVHAAMLFMP